MPYAIRDILMPMPHLSKYPGIFNGDPFPMKRGSGRLGCHPAGRSQQSTRSGCCHKMPQVIYGDGSMSCNSEPESRLERGLRMAMFSIGVHMADMATGHVISKNPNNLWMSIPTKTRLVIHGMLTNVQQGYRVFNPHPYDTVLTTNNIRSW